MHTVFCVMGRTASGKSTLTRLAAEKLNMTVLKSYTTRAARNGENDTNSDHIFIKPEEEDNYKGDMIAWTQRVGYVNFATTSQLLKSDFYVINPSGYYELCNNTKDMDIQLVPIYITVPYRINVERAIKRGDYETWYKNYKAETKEFHDFEKSGNIWYRVLNNCSLDEAVEKLCDIVRKVQNDQ